MPAASARSHSGRGRVRRVAVVEQDRRVGQQRADEEVPHHPAGGREPEDAVVGLRVGVQAELLEVLEEDPALPVDDRLGQPGRARAVEDPERMVERELRERQLAPAHLREIARARRSGPVEVRAATTVCFSVGSSPLQLRDAVACGRSPCRRSGSRRPRAAPSARSARSGRRRCGRRSPASSSTRSRRCSRRRGRRRSSRGCSAGRRRRGRPARRPARAAPAAMRAGLRAQLAPGPVAERPHLGGVADRDGGVVAVAEDVLGVGSRAPGNHSAPGISRLVEDALVRSLARTSKNSQIDAQNASRSSTDHCQSSW